MARSKKPIRYERLNTLQGLIANVITILGVLFAIAAILVLLDVSTNTIVWVIGLFTAGFGLGARPLVSDYLTGVSFLFEDPYTIGEKVELAADVQGVVEHVGIRTTVLRAYTGELYIIPNGEVRLVRNFSRGRFSLAEITLQVHSADLEHTLTLLEELNREAGTLLPNLLEPWQVISKHGELGERTHLTIVAKARFGRAAEMRTNMLALIQKRLADSNIELSS
jgi:small conductance mechanosensitive channel